MWRNLVYLKRRDQINHAHLSQIVVTVPFIAYLQWKGKSPYMLIYIHIHTHAYTFTILCSLMIMAVVILLGSSNHVHHLMIENVNNVFTVALVAPQESQLKVDGHQKRYFHLTYLYFNMWVYDSIVHCYY